MKKTVTYFLIAIFCISCNDDIVVKDNPENVFRAFWNTMNEHYVNFDVRHFNWDSVYRAYYPRVQAMKCDTELISVFHEIIDSLQDKHVAISINDRRYINYDKFFTDSIFVGFGFEWYKFKQIEPCKYDNGYFLYQSQLRDYVCIELLHFNSTFDLSLLKSEIKKLNYSKGVIIVVRNNEGGYIQFPLDILSWFYNGERTLFYQSYKQSLIKNDFSYKKPFLYTGEGFIPESIPVILLTGPHTYSAGNFFAYIMREFPNCISVGLPTGGGDGPIHTELLPNGWTLTYPYFRNYSLKGVRFENSMIPDYIVINNEPSNKVIGNKPIYHDSQFIKALLLLDSINKYPYLDYKKIWD